MIRLDLERKQGVTCSFLKISRGKKDAARFDHRRLSKSNLALEEKAMERKRKAPAVPASLAKRYRQELGIANRLWEGNMKPPRPLS